MPLTQVRQPNVRQWKGGHDSSAESMALAIPNLDSWLKLNCALYMTVSWRTIRML